MVQIDTQGLEQGIHEIDLEPTPQQLDLDPKEFSNIFVKARVDFHPRRVLLRLHASAVAQLICDRTLVGYAQPVKAECVLLFSADPTLVEEGPDYDDVKPLAAGITRLEVTDALRDTLLLALPLRRVAPEAEDVELPRRFGGDDDDGDPRWEALRSLSGK